jgi:hypothetical protein
VLIVIQSLNLISLIPALLLGTVFDVYYLRSSAGLRQSGIFQRYQKRLPIQSLPLASADSLEGLRYYDYGMEAIVYHRVDQLLPLNLLRGLESEFPGIARLDDKLKLTLASYLGYLDIGAVTLFLSAGRKCRRVCFVHATFGSYVHRISNTKDPVLLHHVFLPTDDLASLFAKVVGKMVGQIKKLLEPRAPKVDVTGSTTSQPHDLSDTAVVFHQSVGYGKMFRKLHYFSSNKRSRLHPSKVLKLVLDRQQPLTDVGSEEDPVLRDLRRVSTRQNMLVSARFFLSRITDARSIDELLGVIFLTRMYYGMRSWQVALLEYPGLRNVIIDYDILFPKTLALALEGRGIRTLALQERGSASFASVYCTIADTYLLCGGLFTEYGQRNPSIACRQAVDFGAWRTTFLVGAEVPAFEGLSMQKYGQRSVMDFTSVIAVLGWFTAEQDSESSPFINRLANLDLHARVRNLALAFPDVAVVLRLKLLNGLDRQMASESFSGVQNVFLCDEYTKMNASYALCKRADVIVSVQTSLADECLAAGKKVVVLDSTHNFKNICTDIYPEAFHFAFADDSQHMLDLVSRCLHGDAELAARYDRLKEQLTGEFDLRTPEIIPDTLEQFLL